MTRLARYLKPYFPALVLAIALLFAQANAELALPDYMSRIVDVGIQRGGIDTTAPLVIRAEQLDRMMPFLSASDAELVQSSYSLVGSSDPARADLVSQNPDLTGDDFYLRNELSADDLTRLEDVMKTGMLVVAGLYGGLGQAGGVGGSLLALPEGMSAFAGQDPAAALEALPDQMKARIPQMIKDQFSQLEPMIVDQGASVLVKAEYEALGMNMARIQRSYMLRTGALMLLLTLASAVATITVGFIAGRVAAGFARDVRFAAFERVESFSNREIDKFSTASLITRSTNDVTQIQMVTFMLVRMVFYAPIIGVGGIIRAIGKSSSMWWVIALAVGVLLMLVLVVYFIAVPKFKLMQKLVDRLNLVSRESLAGLMVIRAFSREQYEEDRFDSANQDLTSTTLFVNRVMVVMMPVMMLIMNGLSVLVIWVGAQQIAASDLQVGDMMAFLQYTMQIVMAFLMLSMMFVILPRASVSAGRIADVLETDPSINDPDEPGEFGESFDGSIEFRNVTFRYPNAEEDVLHDISFTARPGEVTAVIGATGSGKSTIVKLIPRFYDVTGGQILIGGKDIREVRQHELRDRMGYVPQKATLFSGTVESNLRYADESAEDVVVQRAIDVAQAREFVDERTEGLQADIAQAGANISGGQKQRLSIARALVGNRPIYLFDDSFSALDFKTDSALRRALAEQSGGSTRLLVTQRVATVKGADRIIVLDDGRIAGQGTHTELMESCETYREIAYSQLTEEELS